MDDLEAAARQAGRQLGLELLANVAPDQAYVTVGYGTVVTVRAEAGSLVADVSMHGGLVEDVPVLSGAASLAPDDRVLVESYENHCVVVGVVARASSGRVAFDWSSNWTGTLADGTTTLATRNVWLNGLVQCEVGASVGGTGEYGLSFTFAQNGMVKAFWIGSTPKRAAGTLKWTGQTCLTVDPGYYDVTINRHIWSGSTVAASADLMWRDAEHPDGFTQYARLIRVGA